jgi:hypothetical protein
MSVAARGAGHTTKHGPQSCHKTTAAASKAAGAGDDTYENRLLRVAVLAAAFVASCSAAHIAEPCALGMHDAPLETCVPLSTLSPLTTRVLHTHSLIRSLTCPTAEKDAQLTMCVCVGCMPVDSSREGSSEIYCTVESSRKTERSEGFRGIETVQ